METLPTQWNVQVQIKSLDRGSVVVKNRWEINDKVTVQIEGHATINMVKQRIGIMVACHPKHQKLSNSAGVELDDIAKLEDCEGVQNGAVLFLDVSQPKEEEAPPVVLSDDEDLWAAEDADCEAMPEGDAMTKELSDDDMDKQNALKQEGAELLEDGDKAAALAKYTQAIMIGAPSAMLICKRAEILLKLKRPKASAQDATAAIAINPDSAKAFRLRGKARRYLADYAGALTDLNKSQGDDYDDAVADIHTYVKNRCAKMTLKAAQDAAAAAAAETTKDA